MSRKATNENREVVPVKGAQLSHSERVNLSSQKRKHAVVRRNFIIFIVFLLIAAVAGTAISAAFFKVNNIVVKNSDKNINISSYYTKEQIIAASGIQTGKNLITLNTSGIRSGIEKALPYIGSVRIDRKLPDRVEITVTDTSAVYAIETAGGYILLNENAKTLENPAAAIPSGAALVTGVAVKEAQVGSVCTFTQQAKYEKLTKLHELFAKYGVPAISKINLESDTDIRFVCENRITCILGSMTSADSKIRLAAKSIAAENEKSYVSDIVIDLSFEGNAYVRPDRDKSDIISVSEPVTA